VNHGAFVLQHNSSLKHLSWRKKLKPAIYW